METSNNLNNQISPYLLSRQKRLFDLVFSLIFFTISLPLQLIISIAILFTAGTPITFTQKRSGKYNKSFRILKFRTMIRGAPQQQWRYQNQNQADGPVFKINNDPRFVGIGRFLARSGLDELPQLINIIKGDMSLVGPRPLPVQEANKIPKKYHSRHLIKPGITSLWVVSGAHNLSFTHWMKLDLHYLKHASLNTDLITTIATIKIIFQMLLPS